MKEISFAPLRRIAARKEGEMMDWSGILRAAPEGWRERRISEAWTLARRPGLSGETGRRALRRLAVICGGPESGLMLKREGAGDD